MAYRCDQAIFGGARDAIRCRVSGSVCAHQKMCMMEGRIVLTDQALWCPARGGRIMPPEADQGAFRSPPETPSESGESEKQENQGAFRSPPETPSEEDQGAFRSPPETPSGKIRTRKTAAKKTTSRGGKSK